MAAKMRAMQWPNGRLQSNHLFSQHLKVIQSVYILFSLRPSPQPTCCGFFLLLFVFSILWLSYFSSAVCHYIRWSPEYRKSAVGINTYDYERLVWKRTIPFSSSDFSQNDSRSRNLKCIETPNKKTNNTNKAPYKYHAFACIACIRPAFVV